MINFFVSLKYNFLCFVATFYLAHDVEAIFSFINCQKHLEIFPEILVMPGKLQIDYHLYSSKDFLGAVSN